VVPFLTKTLAWNVVKALASVLVFTLVFVVSLMPVFRELASDGMDDDALPVYLVALGICTLLGSSSVVGVLIAARRIQNQHAPGRRE
jgi:O-antigen/teichoic acid export membrane protein